MSTDPSSAGVLFRTATKDDLGAIIALLADDELGQTRESILAQARPAYEAAFTAISTDPNNEIIVAEQGGRIVGCLQLTMLPGLTYQGGTRAQIEGVRIASDLRGSGLGKKLFQFAIARAKRDGAFMVQLTTTATRIDAAKFYMDLGFMATHSGLKLKF